MAVKLNDIYVLAYAIACVLLGPARTNFISSPWHTYDRLEYSQTITNYLLLMIKAHI